MLSDPRRGGGGGVRGDSPWPRRLAAVLALGLTLGSAGADEPAKARPRAEARAARAAAKAATKARKRQNRAETPIPTEAKVLMTDQPLAEARPTYRHHGVRRNEYGWGGRSYWLFEPADPAPAQAPVIVFNHGWCAVNPAAYGAWINHLVRSGNVVVFPRYQRDPLTRPARFLANTVDAVRDALDVLDTAPGHVRPDRRRFALIGHSAGGNLAAQMAAVAEEEGLPRPRAVIALMPGEVQPSRLPDLGKIPEETLLVVTVAENDFIVGDSRAREIFAEARAVPASRKRFLFYRSDFRGTPGLLADHFMATGFHDPFDTGDGPLPALQKQRAEINAFDHAGLWPLADLTLHAAFRGKSLDEVRDRTERLKNLGYWSDGRPVARPVVADNLMDVPRVYPSNGFRLIRWAMTPAEPETIASGEPVDRLARRGKGE